MQCGFWSSDITRGIRRWAFDADKVVNPAASILGGAETERNRALLQPQLREVAMETGFDKATVGWVYAHVIDRPENPASPHATRRGVSAEELCEMLIRHANDSRPGELRFILDSTRIQRSEDIGRIVSALVDKGLLVREEDDYLTDFDNLFDVEHLGAYLARRGIRRRWLDWPGVKRRLARTLCVFGAIIVVASFLHAVEIHYGWLGWVIILIGWLLLRLPDKRSASATSPRK